MKIFETVHGLKTSETLYWDFIKASGKVEEYNRWYEAYVDKVLDVI